MNKRFIAFWLVVFWTAVGTSFAQETEVIRQEYKDPDLPKCPTPWEGIDESKVDSMHAVLGIVTDSRSGQPISDVLLIVKEFSLSARSDKHGRFCLTIPERFSNGAFAISIQSHGYDSQERILTSNQLPFVLNISLKQGYIPIQVYPEQIGSVKPQKKSRKLKAKRRE